MEFLAMRYRSFRPCNCILNAFQAWSRDAIVPCAFLQPKRYSNSNIKVKDIFDELEAVTKHRNFQGIRVSLSNFPFPRSKVANYYDHIVQLTNNKQYQMKINYAQHADLRWQCQAEVSWPEKKDFFSNANSKSKAAEIVSLQIIDWLINDCKKMDAFGKPLLKSQLSHHDSPTWTTIKIDDSLLTQAQEFLGPPSNKYEYNTRESGEHMDEIGLNLDGLIPEHFVRAKNLTDSQKNRINYILYKRLEETEKIKKLSLPIDKYRDAVTSSINKNTFTIIKGEPGCGKSSRVPQFVLDDYIRSDRGSDCKIIVSEPRRVSATSLAERVASERNEKIGETVGYHVRLNAQLPKFDGGTITYVTTGMLLQNFKYNKNLEGASHVIIDEVHERDANTDLSMLLLKEATKKNPNLKGVIMSATLDVKLFSNYFGEETKCEVIEVPGFTYPVKQHFLDDEMTKQFGFLLRDEIREPFVEHEKVASFIEWIANTKPPGGILCFLPGWADIKLVENRLKSVAHLRILIAHSKLPYERQKLIFDIYDAKDKRKVVLATNIAESSVTIEDIAYVVDTGAVKETSVGEKNIISLDNQWVSKASAKQRCGRAGRTRVGECFHLYSESKYDSLRDFTVPEIFRTPLASVILNNKLCWLEENSEEFLSKLIEPPARRNVRKAVEELTMLGFLDSDEKLTAFGRRASAFTLAPRISRTLIAAFVNGCLNRALTIATYLSCDLDLFDSSVAHSSNTFLAQNDNASGAFDLKRNLKEADTRNFESSVRKNVDNVFAPSFDTSGEHKLDEKMSHNFESSLRKNVDNVFAPSFDTSGEHRLDEKMSHNFESSVRKNVDNVFTPSFDTFRERKLDEKMSHNFESSAIRNVDIVPNFRKFIASDYDKSMEHDFDMYAERNIDKNVSRSTDSSVTQCSDIQKEQSPQKSNKLELQDFDTFDAQDLDNSNAQYFGNNVPQYFDKNNAQHFSGNITQDLDKHNAQRFGNNLAQDLDKYFGNDHAQDLDFNNAQRFGNDLAQDLDFNNAQRFGNDLAQDLDNNNAQCFGNNLAQDFDKPIIQDFDNNCVTQDSDNSETPDCENLNFDKSMARIVKPKFDKRSDHLAIEKIYREWNYLSENNPNEASKFCAKNNLNEKNLKIFHKLRDMFAQQLRVSGLLQSCDAVDDPNAIYNENSSSDEILTCTLLYGFAHLLRKKIYYTNSGKKIASLFDEDKNKIFISRTSVNYKYENLAQQLFTCADMIHLTERRSIVAKDVSSVCAVGAYLFFPYDFIYSVDRENDDYVCVDLLNAKFSKDTLDVLDRIKMELDDLTEYFVRAEIPPKDVKRFIENCDRKGKLFSLIDNILKNSNYCED